MLNRKASNLIFYLILIGIIVVVYLIRSLMVGGLADKIDDLDSNNISLQLQIDSLKDIVQTNKDIQESQLYELYNQVPQSYYSTELTYLTISKLEMVGIDESSGFDRSITLNSSVTFSSESILGEISKEFDIVEVIIEFDMLDMTVVTNLIDLLNESDQVFFINHIDFYTPDGEDYVGVTINFLSFYEKEDLS